MCFEVLVQMALADEAAVTHFTGIWTVTRVGPLMPLQVTHPGEAKSTEAAAEWPLLGMFGHVPL